MGNWVVESVRYFLEEEMKLMEGSGFWIYDLSDVMHNSDDYVDEHDDY